MQRLVVAFSVVVLLLGISFAVLSATITVPDDYPTIQAAIDAAQPGDTVYVKAGRYKENLAITKPLHLIGEGCTKVIIESRDEKTDVITIDIGQGKVEIQGLEGTSGHIGICVSVAAGAQVNLASVVCYKNEAGIFAVGTGDFFLTQSYLVDNENAGLILGTSRSHVWENEVLGGETGVLLSGKGDFTLEGNLIGLCKWGIDAFTTSCGWDQGEERFTGRVAGNRNRIYGLKTNLCPEHPESPWPEDFIEQAWGNGIDKAFEAYRRGLDLYKSQDYQQAIDAYTTGLAVLEEVQFSLLEANIDENIGVAYDQLGQYEDALGVYEAARAVYESHDMEINIADININIGTVYYHLGRYQDAFSKYVEAFMGYGRHSENRVVNVATFHDHVGDVYYGLGQYKDALEEYQSARAVYVKHGLDVNVAGVDTDIGLVYAELGQYKDALAKYQSAIDVFGSHGMEVDVADINENIGNIYMNLGRYEDALVSHRKALSILDDVPASTEMAYSYSALRWTILDNVGLCHEKQGQWKEAEEAYQGSIAVIESLLSYLRSEEMKTAWYKRTQDVYERMIKLLIEHDQGSEAFQYNERCRTRKLLDRLAMGEAESGAARVIVDENGTRGDVLGVRGIFSGVVEPSAIKAAVDEAANSLRADNAAVVEYFVTDTATYVWVIRDGKVNVPIVINQSRQELMNKVIEAREQLEKQNSVINRDLAELYDWLIRPVEEFLPKTTGEGNVPHLIIIPSGPLYYLPFQALIWTSEDRSEHAPLITRYALSYSPSLATLKYAEQRASSAYPQSIFLALADPDSGNPNIPRLPEAQTESRTVAHLFPASSVYVDKDATEDIMQSQSATASDILLSTHGLFDPHTPMLSYLIVSPTVKNDDGRLYAHEVFELHLHADMVVLSACETLLPSLEDMKGQIRAIRGAGEDTPVELTADQLKELTTGDEVVGLTRAFISAGASSVLSSLWSVPSKATSQLMVSFYKHMEGGMDKAQALRAAELEVMNTTSWTQPWYWAAFNLMGDWR